MVRTFSVLSPSSSYPISLLLLLLLAKGTRLDGGEGRGLARARLDRRSRKNFGKTLNPFPFPRTILSSILSSFLTIFYMFRTSLTATEARIGLRVKETVNESAPRSVRRKRSNTTPSETQSLPSRRKRRSLPLNSVKQRRSEWHEERGERKYSLMKSYKFFGDMTSTHLFSLFLLLYVI
jgi:hypothetical protein